MLHARHAFAFLGRLDAIGDANQTRTDLQWTKQLKAQAHPAGGQDTTVQGLAVKLMKQPVAGLSV